MGAGRRIEVAKGGHLSEDPQQRSSVLKKKKLNRMGEKSGDGRGGKGAERGEGGGVKSLCSNSCNGWLAKGLQTSKHLHAGESRLGGCKRRAKLSCFTHALSSGRN